MHLLHEEETKIRHVLYILFSYCYISIENSGFHLNSLLAYYFLVNFIIDMKLQK